MGSVFDGRGSWSRKGAVREPLVDINNMEPPQPQAAPESRSRRRRLSDAQPDDTEVQPQPPAKPRRPSLATGRADFHEPQPDSCSQPEPRRPRLPNVPTQPEAGMTTETTTGTTRRRLIQAPPEPAAPAMAETATGTSRRRVIEAPPEPAAPAIAETATGASRRRVIEAPIESEEPAPPSRAGRSRGAITHPCDGMPGLQNIIDPSLPVNDAPAPTRNGGYVPDRAPTSSDQDKPSATQSRPTQSLSAALVGGLVATMLGATVWALLATATSYHLGWMAIGVGLLVGGTVRTLGRGVDRSFAHLGLAIAGFGCLLGSLLSFCTVFASQEGLSVLSVLIHICSKPAVIPGAMIATFHPLDLPCYGIAIYLAYQLSVRRSTDAAIDRRVCV